MANRNDNELGVKRRVDGGKLRFHREQKNLTQKQLAAKVKCHTNTISSAENGKLVSLKFLEKIVSILETDIENLVIADADTPAEEPSVGRTLTAVTPVYDFIGRDQEQTDIIAHLKGGGRVCISAIKAAGGMGKTQLAAKCAEQLRGAFAHVLWLRLDGMTTPKKPASLLQDVIRYFRPADKLPEIVADLVPQYLSVLHGKQVLIVLDNAEDAAQVKPLFDPAVPNTVAFLVTSRQKLLLTDAVKTINLELLSEADALTLLRGIVETPSRGTDEEWKVVAKLCGYLPLALRVAGTFVREKTNWSLKRYAQAIRTEALQHLDLGTDDENVGRVLSLSVRQLADNKEKLAELFQMISVFPSDFELSATAFVWNLDPDDTFLKLDELIDYSLVEYDTTTERYHLHDLMRPVARNAFDPWYFPLVENEERLLLAEQRFALHYLSVLEQTDELISFKVQDFLAASKLFNEEKSNIRYAQDWAVKRLQNDSNDQFAAEMVARYPIYGSYQASLHLSVWAERISWLTASTEAGKKIGNKKMVTLQPRELALRVGASCCKPSA